jgi:hypothetical protein
MCVSTFHVVSPETRCLDQKSKRSRLLVGVYPSLFLSASWRRGSNVQSCAGTGGRDAGHRRCALLRLPALILRRPIIGMLWLLLRPLPRLIVLLLRGILLPTL